MSKNKVKGKGEKAEATTAPKGEAKNTAKETKPKEEKAKRVAKVRLNAVQKAESLLKDGNILHDPKKVKSVYIKDSKGKTLMRVQTPTSQALFKLCKVVEENKDFTNYALKA